MFLLFIAKESFTFVLKHLCEGNCENPNHFWKAWKRFKINSKSLYALLLICRMGNNVWFGPSNSGQKKTAGFSNREPWAGRVSTLTFHELLGWSAFCCHLPHSSQWGSQNPSPYSIFAGAAEVREEQELKQQKKKGKWTGWRWRRRRKKWRRWRSWEDETRGFWKEVSRVRSRRRGRVEGRRGEDVYLAPIATWKDTVSRPGLPRKRPSARWSEALKTLLLRKHCPRPFNNPGFARRKASGWCGFSAKKRAREKKTRCLLMSAQSPSAHKPRWGPENGSCRANVSAALNGPCTRGLIYNRCFLL